EIYPPEKLRARGFPVTDLPREENAAFLYIDAINMLGPEEAELPISEAAAGEWPDGEAGERLNAYLESQQPVLDLARAASRMPDYHLPLFCGETDALINAVLPALRHQRQLARLLAADAHRQARAGNHAGAIDRLLAAQRMGHQLAHGTTMIEGLVGIAIGQLSSDQLLMIAAAHDMDPTLLRAASDEMEVLAADMPTIDDMMRGEEMFSLTMM